MKQAKLVWILSVQQGHARPVQTPCDSGLVEMAATTHGFPSLEQIQRSPHWRNRLRLPCRSARNWAALQLEAEVSSFDSSSWNCLFGRDIENWHASGMSQRRWTIQVALPRYMAALERAVTPPKQLLLPLSA